MNATRGRGLAYALAASASLAATLAAAPMARVQDWIGALVATAVLAALLFGALPWRQAWHFSGAGAPGTQFVQRWAMLLGALLALAFLAGVPLTPLRAPLLVWALGTPPLWLLLNALSVRLAQPRSGARRTAVIVFVNDTARELAARLLASPDYELVGFFEDRELARVGGAIEGLAYLGRLPGLGRYVRDHDIHSVFVILPDEGARRALALTDELSEVRASVYYLPDPLVLHLREAVPRQVEGLSVLQLPESVLWGADGRLKRGFDVIVALALLLLLWPLLLGIAGRLWLRGVRPVLQPQRCYALDGRRFAAYRFRAASAGPTRAGLDLLPQLYNVLRGDMSLVGPRAHSVAHNELYRRAFRQHFLRSRVRPGLTGWAQVRRPQDTARHLDNVEEQLRDDLDYVRRWSPWLDLRILALALARALRGGES